MTRFLDGPAAGAILTLKRAPLYLRAVIPRTPGGEWDALDQLADAVGPEEDVHVYRRDGRAGSVHVDGRDKQGRRRGWWYAAADYRLAADQPLAETVRDTAAWRAWCLDRQAKERAAA